MSPSSSSIVLTSEELSVIFVPEQGARITSLVNRHDGREWLAQARGDVTRARAGDGATYTATDHCGLDEMFPTVDPCWYPAPPYEGVEVPDHGELWSRAWRVVDTSDVAATHRFESERFHYAFQRRLSVRGSTLRADYRVTVEGAAAWLLWALHPQFATREGTRLTLSGDRVHLLDTSAPMAPERRAWTGDLVVERDLVEGEDRMLYLYPEDHADEATLKDPDGSWLRVRWDRGFAKYLGLWIDRSRYASGSVVAIEPTSGFFDELTRCYERGTIVEFRPAEPVTWWVEIDVGQGPA